jgi:Flp pilus assembly protein TadD
LSHFEESLRLAEKLGDEAQQARVLQSLASLDLRESQYSQALSRLQRATEIADRLGLAEKNQIHKMRDNALTKAR